MAVQSWGKIEKNNTELLQSYKTKWLMDPNYILKSTINTLHNIILVFLWEYISLFPNVLQVWAILTQFPQKQHIQERVMCN